MFQVTITVRIVAKTTSKPIALRCVFGFSIFFSWYWPARTSLSHRKMHADACATDRLHLPVVRPCAVRYVSALSTLPEIASSDRQEQQPDNNCRHNNYGLRHTRHTSTSLRGLRHRARLLGGSQRPAWRRAVACAGRQAFCSRFVQPI